MSTVIDGSNSVTINSGAVLGITSGTAQASTSGTSIDFTGIPSWVKRITVMFNGVSTSGGSAVQVQIGSGSVDTTGYAQYGGICGSTSSAGLSATAGFQIDIGTPTSASIRNGAMVIFNISGNLWGNTFVIGHNITTNNYSMSGGGTKTLSGILDRVRITTVNGTDTFDLGSINILYE